jgi:NADP-dependent 3-hydroxy acid dehydrogenase YdfG
VLLVAELTFIGIGLMMAKALTENGAAKVYIVGRREDKLKEAAQFHPR